MHDSIVNVNADGSGFVMWLFPDTTPLHVWRMQHNSAVDMLPKFAEQGYAHSHSFAPGESFRLDWQGAELVIVDKKTGASVRYDQVCMIQEQRTAGEPITRVFRGWISPELINRHPHKGENITVEIVKKIDVVTPEEAVEEVSA